MVKPGYTQKLGKRQGEYYRRTRDVLLSHHDRMTDKANPGAKAMLRAIMERLDMLADEFDPPDLDISGL